jgi:hypothetical protein
MGAYIFRQRCRPQGDLRIPQVMEFLDLVKEAFRCSALYDRKNMTVNLTETELWKVFKRGTNRLFPTVGATMYFYTIPPRNRDDNTVAIEIHTGTQTEEIFIDTYNISMGDKSKLPDFHYLERSIEIFKPFEAFLAEKENEAGLDAFNRQQADPRFSRPAIIRGFHYLDEGMARSIGGIDYCLNAPAWRVRRFCEGVLIEVVPGPFDSRNPDHVQIQKHVMAYFDMLV